MAGEAIGRGRRRALRSRHAGACRGALAALLLGAAAAADEAPIAAAAETGFPIYFAVLTDNIDVSSRFYRDTFGLTVRDDNEHPDGRWRIVNLESDALAVELIRDARASEADRPLGFFKVGFRVPDVNEIADRLETATGERPRIVRHEAHGIDILQIRDPDDNVLQLSSAIDD